MVSMHMYSIYRAIGVWDKTNMLHIGYAFKEYAVGAVKRRLDGHCLLVASANSQLVGSIKPPLDFTSF